MDVLVLDELCLSQIDAVARAVRSALIDLALPQVIATLNSNTNHIEVGLLEEVYPSRQNTDEPVRLKSAVRGPHLLSVGVVREIDQSSGSVFDATVLDCDSLEIQCVDQILHLSIGDASGSDGSRRVSSESKPVIYGFE